MWCERHYAVKRGGEFRCRDCHAYYLWLPTGATWASAEAVKAMREIRK